MSKKKTCPDCKSPMAEAIYGMPSEEDFENIDKGEARSYNLLAKEIMAYKAADHLATWQLPIYFVQGKYDMATPTSLVEDYVQKAESVDHREYRVFKTASHFAHWEDRKSFLKLLLKIKGRLRK